MAIVMWQGETRYHFGPVESSLVTRRGAIADGNGFRDKVEWGKGTQVAEIKADTAPGQYGDVTVIAKRLDKNGYFLDLWQHPWAVARTANCEPFSPEHYEAMEGLWEMLGEAGQKTLTVTLIELPWNHQCYDGYGTMVKVTETEQGFVYDFSRFDEYVEFGKRCGIGPYISLWTMCPWGNIHHWRSGAGDEIVRELKPGTGEYEKFWRPYLKALRAHLEENGWLGSVFMAMDERRPEEVAAAVQLIKEEAPELKVQMAGDRAATEFDGIEIDYYSQSLEHLTEEFKAIAKRRKQQGLITTFYVCCHPESPNTFMSSPKEEAFGLGAMAADLGLDGFLRWAYNSWPEDPDKDASYGNWPAGDTFLVYPDGSPSVRFLELMNGIAEAEKRKQG